MTQQMFAYEGFRFYVWISHISRLGTQTVPVVVAISAIPAEPVQTLQWVMRGTDKRGGGSEGRDEKTIPKKGEKWSFHQETCHRLNLPFSNCPHFIPFSLLIFSLSVLCMLFCLFSDFKTEKCVLVNTKSCQLLLNLIDLDVNGARHGNMKSSKTSR